MKNKHGFLFIPATVFLTVALTYFLIEQMPRQTVARITFQIASQTGPRISLDEESKLILSNTLLAQVIKDINLAPQKTISKFRSFDLGPNFKVQDKSIVESLKELENSLSVYAYQDKSWIGIEYKGNDAERAGKIVETVFEKYRDWRKTSPAFSQEMVRADRELSERRDSS